MPRTHPRPGPEGQPQLPYLTLPQGSHVPRVPAAPGTQETDVLLETQAHHLLGPGLEMALWGVGYIPWYWGTQFPLSVNSPDEPFQGLETEAGRQAGNFLKPWNTWLTALGS